jgi:hypothetical protein
MSPKAERIWKDIDLPTILRFQPDGEPTRPATIHTNEHLYSMLLADLPDY